MIPTRKELLASKEWWRVIVALSLWRNNNKKHMSKWEKVATKIVDDNFMESIKWLSETP